MTIVAWHGTQGHTRWRRRLCELALCALASTPAWAQGEPSAAGPGDTFVRTHSFRLSAPVVAIAREDAAPVALTADGTVVRLGLDGPTFVGTVGPGHPGTLVPCGGTLWVVDARGLLVGMPEVLGPEVSLHATPVCTNDGHLLAIDPYGWTLMRIDSEGVVTARADLEVVPDAALVALGDGSIAIAIDPTLEYRHGILGDEVEARGVAVVDPSTLAIVSTWTAPEGRVVEQRAVTPWPAVGRFGMLVTVSGGGDGGALVALAATRSGTLGVRAAALGLGAEGRWRHVLPTATLRAYSVATPHVGGVLERWALVPDDGTSIRQVREGDDGPTDAFLRGGLSRTAFDERVASHRIGERRLGWAVLVDRVDGDDARVDALLVPRADRRTYRLVVCGVVACDDVARFTLDAPAASEPSVRRGRSGFVEVWIGDESGDVHRFAWAGALPFPDAE